MRETMIWRHNRKYGQPAYLSLNVDLNIWKDFGASNDENEESSELYNSLPFVPSGNESDKG